MVITVLGVVGWVSAAGYDSERTLSWIGTNIGPVLLLLVNLVVSQRTRDDAAIVKHRTNGVLDAVFERLRALEQAAPTQQRPAPGGAPNVTQDWRDGEPPSSTGPG